MPMPRVSAAQREIRQRRPFRSMSHEAVVVLFRTADLARRTLTAAVAPAGLTFQQYNVLRILRGAGAAGLPTLEVADRMVESTPGITRMMDRLEARGWVTRERSVPDRREVRCRITPAGLELLGRLDSPVDQADRRAMGSLEDAKLRTLVALLDEIRAAHPVLPASARGAAPTPTAPRMRRGRAMNR